MNEAAIEVWENIPQANQEHQTGSKKSLTIELETVIVFQNLILTAHYSFQYVVPGLPIQLNIFLVHYFQCYPVFLPLIRGNFPYWKLTLQLYHFLNS